MKNLYNSALSGTTDTFPITDEEADLIARQLINFADPRLIKIVMKGDEIVGFLFGYPDPSAAIQRCKGKLLPFGWLDILIELRRTRWINLNGAGLLEKYRGSGGTALLFAEMYKSVREQRPLSARRRGADRRGERQDAARDRRPGDRLLQSAPDVSEEYGVIRLSVNRCAITAT